MDSNKNIKVQEALPKIVFLLIVLQPLLDILSFWTNRLEMGNTLTLALRFLMLVGFGLFGFSLSRRKRAYWILAAVYLILLIGHIYACLQRGYRNPVYDLTNFVRVAQMPLFAFCLITCLRRNRRCYRAIEKGLTANFWIITIALLISVITKTADPTYEESGYGLVGWFTFGNSQSAILSFLVPIAVTLAYRERNLPIFILTTAAGFGQLYLLGTRLAFLSIFVTAVGLVIVALMTKSFEKRYVLVLIVACALCAGTVKMSPMYLNQHQYEEAMASKQSDAEAMINKKSNQSPEQKLRGLQFVYHFYSPRMCMRFGTDRVMDKYDQTSLVSEITATRHQKIMFCKLLMDEHPAASKIFGMELGRMQFHNYIYDVENDFHGVFFLFGAAGLVLMALFIGFFLYLIIKALLTDFRKYFTIEAGAFGIALCLTLVNAYATAGVLRRPNASFYMSLLLAVIYYLVILRVYPPKQLREKEPQA
jgi:general stress protein CsbA